MVGRPDAREDPTVIPDPPSAIDELLTAARSVTRELGAFLEPDLGLTVDQWRVLRRLDPLAGMTMTELGDALEVPAASTTRLVDSLVDRGLVHRRATDGDRRRVMVLQTDEGSELAQRADELVAQHSRPFLSGVGLAHQPAPTSLRR